MSWNENDVWQDILAEEEYEKKLKEQAYSEKQAEAGGHRHDAEADKIEKRNQQIVEDFIKERLKNRYLTPNAFANRFAAGHKLKPRQVRTILKLALGS